MSSSPSNTLIELNLQLILHDYCYWFFKQWVFFGHCLRTVKMSMPTRRFNTSALILANVFFWKCHDSVMTDQKKIILTHPPYFLLLVRLSWKGRKFTLLWMYATSCKKRELFSERVNDGMESNKFLFLCHFKSWQRFNLWASESQLENCFCR